VRLWFTAKRTGQVKARAAPVLQGETATQVVVRQEARDKARGSARAKGKTAKDKMPLRGQE